MVIEDKGLMIEDNDLMIEDKAMVIEDKGLMIEDKGLMIEDNDLMIEDKGSGRGKRRRKSALRSIFSGAGPSFRVAILQPSTKGRRLMRFHSVFGLGPGIFGLGPPWWWGT